MSKKVVIAFLGSFKFDARCLNMANSLYKNGYNVFIVDELSDNKIFKSDKYNILHVNTKSKRGIGRYLRFSRSVQDIVYKIRPNIFISGDIFSLRVCSNIKWSCLKVYDCRELYSQLSALKDKPIKQFFWEKFEKINYKYVDKVIVTAQKDRDYLISRYGNKNINIIFNYPNISIKDSSLDLRQKYSISEHKKIFLYQGAIQAGRGIEEMIKLLLYFEDSVACIAGEGLFKREIIKISIKLKVEKRVFFTGNIPYEKLISVSQQADIGFALIQPISQSYRQALPNKLFEYGLAGLPTIASDFVEMKKYINKYNLGIAVNPVNTNEHIRAVNQLLSWNNKEHLINIIKKNCSWQTQENSFLNIFN